MEVWRCVQYGNVSRTAKQFCWVGGLSVWDANFEGGGGERAWTYTFLEIGIEVRTVEPGYNDIGLYDTSSIASDIVVPINSSFNHNIIFLGYNNTSL
jgi:hypothetical protein